MTEMQTQAAQTRASAIATAAAELCDACEGEVEEVFAGEIGEELNALRVALASVDDAPSAADAAMIDLLEELADNLDAQIARDSDAHWSRHVFLPNHPQQTSREKYEHFEGSEQHTLLTRTRDAIAALRCD